MSFNPKFDIDLKYGQEGEEWLKMLGAGEVKLEVKRDRGWRKSGNFYFEYYYKGKKSGVAGTEAEYFVYILTSDIDAALAVYIWEVDMLRRNLKKLWPSVRHVSGGDGMLTRGMLVPISMAHELVRV